MPNIIIFGETGTGKSSLINLIANDKIAKTSSGAAGCTLDAQSYLVPIGTRKFRLWDTVGLNEPSLGVNGYLVAIEKAYKLICDLEREGGITLLMFCMRGGRITAAAQSNYRLFFDILCNKEVPIALVITNLENEPSMEGWWEANKKQFDRFGMHSVGHACITAHPGLGGVHSDKYLESRQRMHNLLLSQTGRQAWKPEKTDWFTRLSGQLRNWIFRRSPGSFRPGPEELARKLRNCGFSKYEAQYVARKIVEVKNCSDDSLDTSSSQSDE
ncbi:P-loop containing nucleoside triphosphate hydrolase protein [Hygrophoropsis aurantiaca]|uniref:P-loop containing nucleoside triphosphate hydrolase protein n=1 Tax=Hygrophoropsis aurantiaca TaxID=72124 RepID=A0ACB8AKH8_9AGAM|nr:P-loop containing nucleoside triphosphate hydrolase protein [Hygrophoropsis aurantiaca]